MLASLRVDAGQRNMLKEIPAGIGGSHGTEGLGACG